MMLKWIASLGRHKRTTKNGKGQEVTTPSMRDQLERKAAATRRVAESEVLLAQVHQREPRVMAHAHEIRTLRIENGFAALVLDAFRGTK